MQKTTTLILILLIHMSNSAEESISTICVILSFLCSSLDIMCHPCLHNSQVPDPALFASHTDHKSESTLINHVPLNTESSWTSQAKTPLGRSCRTLKGLGVAGLSPEYMGIGTSTVVLSTEHPLVGCLSQAVWRAAGVGGVGGGENHPAPSPWPISTHFYFHVMHGNCTVHSSTMPPLCKYSEWGKRSLWNTQNSVANGSCFRWC